MGLLEQGLQLVEPDFTLFVYGGVVVVFLHERAFVELGDVVEQFVGIG